MILSYCSNGDRVSQATIDKRYSESLRKKYAFAGSQSSVICDGCKKRPSVHSDHTIARARCKQIHKTELIWDPDNYVRSCEKCHREWESFKSGEWTLHLNSEQRLRFLKKHDPEGFRVRVELTTHILKQQTANENTTNRQEG